MNVICKIPSNLALYGGDLLVSSGCVCVQGEGQKTCHGEM